MKLKELSEELHNSRNIIYKDKTGYITGYLKSNGYWHIDKFVLNPEYRGKGLAKELANHIPQHAELLAYPLFNDGPNVLPKEALIDFYKRLGFREFPDHNGNMIMIRESLTEELEQHNGRWALVSKTTGRVLRYYKGSGKPPQDWVDKMEAEIQMFKHLKPKKLM